MVLIEHSHEATLQREMLAIINLIAILHKVKENAVAIYRYVLPHIVSAETILF